MLRSSCFNGVHYNHSHSLCLAYILESNRERQCSNTTSVSNLSQTRLWQHLDSNGYATSLRKWCVRDDMHHQREGWVPGYWDTWQLIFTTCSCVRYMGAYALEQHARPGWLVIGGPRKQNDISRRTGMPGQRPPNTCLKHHIRCEQGSTSTTKRFPNTVLRISRFTLPYSQNCVGDPRSCEAQCRIPFDALNTAPQFHWLGRREHQPSNQTCLEATCDA